MLFDIIFGIFVAGLVGLASNTTAPEDPFRSQVTPPPSAPLDGADDAAPEADAAPAMPAASAPEDIQDQILQQLSCAGDLDPTAAMLGLMQAKMVMQEERIAFESISCFPIHGASAIVGMRFDMVCASVTDAEAAQMPMIYDPDPDYPGYPMLSLGTAATDLNGLRDWATQQFGSERAAEAVIDGLYTPENIPVEVYCAAPGVRD